MTALYPLRFRPIFRRYIWGGRRLGTLLGKQIGPGDDYAESWEICDHGPDQSVVDAGPLAETTLAELLARRGDDLLGIHAPQAHFPLLLKFLDATRTLSVQVHPNDQQAAQLTPPDLGKTEAWIILAAEPDSLVYAGLKQGVDRNALAAAIKHGSCEDMLHRFQPRVGDCLLLRAGTVHALGKGLLVAEIQQSSDTTFRLFDWGRLGPDGKPRSLHVRQGLDVIDYDLGPVGPTRPTASDGPPIERLAQCDKFVLDRWKLDSPAVIGGDRRCHIISLLEGVLAVHGDAVGEPLRGGGSMLLPASLGEVRLSPRQPSVLLDAYLP
jgi:mannose-6-phosphate isomerase